MRKITSTDKVFMICSSCRKAELSALPEQFQTRLSPKSVAATTND